MNPNVNQSHAQAPGIRTALIGHTGFVGSNLARQRVFTHHFNSRNIGDLRDQSFDTVVCAGVQAVKWKANQDPAGDWAGIERLLDPLSTITARRFVLLSTIDVYRDPNGVTEDDAPPPGNHTYGQHRLRVEEFVRTQFPAHHIVRLPGLFGSGLKKNVIYDLLHDNCLDAIQPASSFQYYDLNHLGADMDKVVDQDLPLIHFATEPVRTQTIIDRFASGKSVGSKAGPAVHYDFRSKYDPLWGGHGGYLYDAATVLREMGDFMKADRSCAE